VDAERPFFEGGFLLFSGKLNRGQALDSLRFGLKAK
jgi:hypothetical protein